MLFPGLKSGRFLSLVLLFVCVRLHRSFTTSTTTPTNASASTVSSTSAPSSSTVSSTSAPSSSTTEAYTITTPVSISTTTADDTTTTPVLTSKPTTDTTTTRAETSTTIADDTNILTLTSTTITADITTTRATTLITTADDTTTYAVATTIQIPTSTTTAAATTTDAPNIISTAVGTTITTYAPVLTTTSADTMTLAATETSKTPMISPKTLSLSYDCRRLSDCGEGGNCDLNSGKCICQSGYTEYNCAFLNDTRRSSCDKECQNGGICYNGNECACPFGYYGNSCTNTTVNVECGADTIKVRISLGENFGGKVYIFGNASCTLPQTGTSSKLFHYELEVALNGTGCGYFNLSKNEDTGEITQLVRLFVQYDNDTYTPVDEVYDMSCVISGNNVTVSSVAVVGEPDPANNFTKQYIIQTVKGVTFKMTGKDGKPLEVGKVYSVADPFNMSVQLTEVEAYRYSSVKFQWCTVSNNSASAVGRLFLDNGCTTNFGKSFVTNEQVQGNATINGKTLGNSDVSMKLLKFVNSTEVKFTCMVTKCSQDNTQCKLNCGSSGRKKRAAVPYSDDFEISTVLKVTDSPQDTGSGTKNGDVSSKITKTLIDCMQMGEMIAVLSSMLALICILGASCIFTTCIMGKRGKKIVHLQQKIENFEHKHSYFTMFH